MAILAYVGLPGSGKSYSAVAHSVVPALVEGRAVVTNMLLDTAALAQKIGRSVSVLPLPSTSEAWRDVPKGALVVVDEAWRWWPSGQRAAKMPEPEREFFAMHRHQVDEAGNAQQIVLVSQGLNQLNAFVKNLVETTFVTKKLQAVGAAGQYRVDVYDGIEQREEKRIRQIFGSYTADIWSLYRSHTASAAGAAKVNEKTLDQRASVLKSWAVKVGVPLGVVALVVAGVGAVYSLQHMGGPKAEQSAGPASASKGAAEGAGRPLAPPAPPSPTYSQQWRVVALIDPEARGQRSLVFVEGLAGLLRQVDPAECKRVLLETWCMVDGAWATPWSGPDSVRRIAVAEKVKESGTAPGVRPPTMGQRADTAANSGKGS